MLEQAMLQLHLIDQQFYCLINKVCLILEVSQQSFFYTRGLEYQEVSMSKYLLFDKNIQMVFMRFL